MVKNKYNPRGREAAEAVALQALAYLLGDPDRLQGFMAASGADPAGLRERVADPVFLGFVLDYLMADEASVVAFAEDHALDPARLAGLRALLPGATET